MSLLLIENGKVIDGTGREPIEDCNLIIKGGRIEKVAKEAAVPAGVERVDVSGMTVMPGLIDSHLHLAFAAVKGVKDDPTQKALSRLTALPSSFAFGAYVNGLKCLEAGFTTVRDCGSRGDSVLSLRNAINAGWVKGPRIQVGGSITATMGHFDEGWPVTLPRPEAKYVVDGPYNIRRAVRERVHEGVDFIKTCTSDSWSLTRSRSWWRNYTMEELKALTEEAHAFGMAVSAHAYDAVPSVRNAVLAGVDNIDHGLFLNEEVVELMKEHGTSLSPTLVTIKKMYLEGSPIPGSIPDYEQRSKEVWELHQKSAKMAIKAGIPVGASTDANMGYDLMGNNAWELEILVDLGMTTMEAIMAATKVNAEIMRLDKELGTLEPGKLADIIVVDGDPLKNISVLTDKTKIKLVMKEGKAVVDRMQ